MLLDQFWVNSAIWSVEAWCDVNPRNVRSSLSSEGHVSTWKGFDPGGAEYLLRRETLLGTLEIFGRHEPFDRRDPESPVYAELEMFDSYAWRRWDKHGEFRPVFRARNVWQALGLIEDTEQGTVLTETAELLLSGQVTFEQMMAAAAAGHQEHGLRPYAVVASALLEEPHRLFSMTDIEFGLSRILAPGEQPVVEVLLETLVSLHDQLDSLRSRRLRSFMKVLEQANAVSRYGAGATVTWGAKDEDVLELIASGSTSFTYGPRPASPRTNASRGGNGQGRRTDRSDFPVAGSSNMTSRSFTGSGVVQDPAQRLLALERSTRIHQDLVRAISQRLVGMGLDPREDVNSFDIGVFRPGNTLIEVKSIHSNNAQSQIRKAISQLLEYRWLHDLPEDTRLLIAVNADPRPWLPPGYLDFVEGIGVECFWAYGTDFVNLSSTSIYDAFS